MSSSYSQCREHVFQPHLMLPLVAEVVFVEERLLQAQMQVAEHDLLRVIVEPGAPDLGDESPNHDPLQLYRVWFANR